MATRAGSGCFESFMGTEGTIRISERTLYSNIVREDGAPSWAPLVQRGVIKEKAACPQPETTAFGAISLI